MWGVLNYNIFDENYTDNEEEIIKKTLLELGVKKENLSSTIKEAKIIEENSNQILEFTREVKNLSESEKIKIIEAIIFFSLKYSSSYTSPMCTTLPLAGEIILFSPRFLLIAGLLKN